MRDVAFSCDDNGAKFLCVTAWSLLHHYRGSEPIRINVFEGFGGHSEESKRKLGEVIAQFPNASVRYIDVESAVRPHADLIMNRERSRWNVFTWTPIFTPMLLTDATGNVAHFDIDMLFNDDVSKILDLDLGDNLIAAVAEYGNGDPVITEAVWGKGILPSEAERYFNTGTIVFNSEKCREECTWEKILEWYREHYDIADRIEQDAWNALYWRRTMLLPLKWNFHDRLVKSFARWDMSAKYWQGNQPRECLEAALKPSILHFWGPKKPWKVCHRPYRGLYHQAMKAVGQIPPRASFLAPYHNIANAISLLLVRCRRSFFVGNHNYAWSRRIRRKQLKHCAELPFEWLGIGIVALLLAVLPRRGMQGLCDALSRVMYTFDRRGRRRALEVLHVVRGTATAVEGTPDFNPDAAAYAPTAAEEKIIRRSYRNMARSVGYAFWSCFRAVSRCRATGELSDECRAFLSANKPAVTVSGHLGCWEILSQLAFLEGHSMMSVAKDIGTRGMTRMLMRARRAIGQDIVPAEGAFKPLMAGIRTGKSLGLLVDQHVDPNDGGIWVEFLNRPMTVSAAPAFFAAKAKAPIVVAWSRPLKDGRYRCEMVKVISAEDAKDIRGTTQLIAGELAGVIRRHPSCWVLNYNYFNERVPAKGVSK